MSARVPDQGSPDQVQVAEMASRLQAELLRRREADGHWEGRLSTSALSTAVAAMVFTDAATSLPASAAQKQRWRELAAGGYRWLAANINADGGYGDTTRSRTNISTTCLCWAALSGAPDGEHRRLTLAKIENWLAETCGSLRPEQVAAAIARRYGKDQTFSVPILTVLALRGRLDGWHRVPQLPFELAACPQSWLRFLNLRVVSYALPALVAIGQVRHQRLPARNPVSRWLRSSLVSRTLRVLARIQPEPGGFLEAVPLTSFVALSLIASGQGQHVVVKRSLKFLEHSVRKDGSWPIDTHLATWVTTLAVNALQARDAGREALSESDRQQLRTWLRRQQWTTKHPFTGANPGGFAWTPLVGGVPDADDTAGALLALWNLGATADDCVLAAIRWLLALQNGNGGIPTFCRGWGRLQFDQSSPDLTAHALRAFAVWADVLPRPLQHKVASSRRRALQYLRGAQNDDGSFVPLWFGNEWAKDDENKLYGTSRVVQALAVLSPLEQKEATMLDRARDWLIQCQNEDGSFGGAPGIAGSVEETGLAVQALARTEGVPRTTLLRALMWIDSRTKAGARVAASPIGFYFARLWYFEDFYPWIFAYEAAARGLAAVCQR